MMGVFNNLVMYKQDEPQNSMKSIVPDLATSWSWSEDDTELTFKLRQGVKWHDGKPFTAADVKCTYDLLPARRKRSFGLTRVKPGSATLKRLLRTATAKRLFICTGRNRRSSPCSPPGTRRSTHAMCRRATCAPTRSAPGPSNLSRSKQTSRSEFERNPDYWKSGRPYLDGIEYTIVPNRSTAILAFVAGKLDMTWPYIITVPLLKDIQNQVPQAICELKTTNASTNLLVNRDAAPFNNADLRRAMALALDRKAFIDIISDGKAKIGGAMLPPPEGLWGMPPELLETLPGYGPDVQKNRAEARNIMEKLGYGPDKRLALKVSARNLNSYRDPAVIAIDQLKEVYIDGELDTVETANWHAKVTRKDYSVAVNGTGSGVDDPDQQFYENYACGSDRNYSGYCNPEIDKEIDRQSIEPDQEKRKKLVWEIDRKLQEDGARPIITQNLAGTCWQPHVKGLTMMVNSIYNGWRFEDVWLDK